MVWQTKPVKLRHKDRDARSQVKFGKAKAPTGGTSVRKVVDIAVPECGYQNHIAVDRGYGLIHGWRATDAGQHETTQLRNGLLAANATPKYVRIWATGAKKRMLTARERLC